MSNVVYVGNASFFRPWSKAAHIKREWLAATYGALRRQMQQAWYMAKYASILKPWSGTAHNKREGLERYLVLQARMTSNLVLQAIEQKYALHRNMKSSIREICLFLKALKQNSQFQARMTWFILRSSKHLNKTALTAETLDAAYEKYASFVKPWSKRTHFKGGSRETNGIPRPIKRNRVSHWHVQYAWNMPFSPGKETKLLDAEFDRSKICFTISLLRWKKLVNRNMK